MKVIRREQHGAEILGLVGRLTAGNGVRALRGLESALLDGSERDLVVDLSQVDYVDAAGIGELLRLRRKAMTHGTNLVLSGLTARVQDVLGVTQLASELDIAIDVSAALARINHGNNAAIGPVTSPPVSTDDPAIRRAASAYHIPVIVAL